MQRFAFCAALLVALSAHAQQPTSGFIGAYRDPGSGILIADSNDASTVDAEFVVGTAGTAPYAREHIQMSPTVSRAAGTLHIDLHANVKREEALIPPALGAFWEITLQNEEGNLPGVVFLLVGGRRIAPRPGSSDFDVPAGLQPPYRFVVHAKFFNTTHDFNFYLDTEGVSRHETKPSDDAAIHLDVSPAEVQCTKEAVASMHAVIRRAGAEAATFVFVLAHKGSPDEPFEVPSSTNSAELTVTFSPQDEGYLLRDGAERIALLEPGEYTITARGLRSGRPPLYSNSAPLTLHPQTIIKVYDPEKDRGGGSIWSVKNMETVVFKQPFRIAVLGSPYAKSAPDSISVTLKSSRDELSQKLTRVEGGGETLAAWDMKGSTATAYGHWVASQTVEHLLDRLQVKSAGETITISYQDAVAHLKVEPNLYEADARRLLEMLRDYKALYDALVSNVALTQRTHAEFQEKANALERAIALHEPSRNVPAMVRVTVSEAYLRIIQRPLGDFGRFGIRHVSPAVLKERLKGQSVLVGSDLEDREVTDAIREANQMAWQRLGGVLTEVANYPADIIESIPSMLASPAYSAYTLYSGRQLDGSWASSQQRFFAGVDVALTLVPLSVKVIKFARPTLFERAVARLTAVGAAVGFDEQAYASFLAKIDKKISKRLSAITRWEQIVANAEEELKMIPSKRGALDAEISNLTKQLKAMDTESDAAKKIALNKQKIRDIEGRYRSQKRMPTPAERDAIKNSMTQITKKTELLDRQKGNLVKAIDDAKRAHRQLFADAADANRRISTYTKKIAEGHEKIAQWKNTRWNGVDPSQAKRMARRLKLQGNDGEKLAFEAVSRDGFVRHLEPGRALPNQMANWKEIGQIADLFDRQTQLAEELGIDADELAEMIKAGDAAEPELMAKARETIQQWQRTGVPYYPGGSIGPDGLYWNPKTNHFRIVEVKTGGAQLGATQLTNDGVARWIDLMRDPANKLYWPAGAEAMNVALRSGTLERVIVRVVDGAIVSAELVDDVGGVMKTIPVK